MQVCFRWALICLCLLVSRSVLSADAPAPPASPAESKSPAAEPKSPAAEPKPGPGKAQFDQLFSQWKSILADLRQLRGEYNTAAPERRTEIEGQYGQLIQKGVNLQPKLIEAAKNAYAAAPNANKELTEFLASVVYGEVRRDNYEEALRLAELLINNQCGVKQLYDVAGIAAFAVSKYDLAEKYFKLAEENDARKGSGQPSLNQLIEDFLSNPARYKNAWQREQQIRAAEAKANDLPRVLLKTNKGDIEIALFENEAPIAVANFISLIEKGFYDGLTFHRVLPGFMAQGGCPTGDGTGGPGYNIPCECHQPNHRNHFRGSLSMAHAGRDTGGSQFFLTFVPTSFLDGRHTAFGRVVKGIDVLAKIRRRDPQAPDPPKPDRIIQAKVLQKRPHEYKPQKTGQ